MWGHLPSDDRLNILRFTRRSIRGIDPTLVMVLQNHYTYILPNFLIILFVLDYLICILLFVSKILLSEKYVHKNLFAKFEFNVHIFMY